MTQGNESRNMSICERFEAALLERHSVQARGGVLTDDLRQHGALCPRCADLLAECQELDVLLRELAETDAREGLPAAVEVQLLREFRGAWSGLPSRKPTWHLAALAAAAAVLVVLGISVRRFVPSTRGTAAVVTPSGTAVADAGEQTSAADGAENFVALAYGDDDSSAEDGAIVRVLMPRSTLASLGIPVADIGDERVPAEVVLGEDGTPQAIRLVSQEHMGEF